VVYQGFFCCWGSWKSFNERCTLVLRNIYTKCSKSIRSNSYECSGWIILNPKTCWQTFITVSLARFQRFAISFVITNFRPLNFFLNTHRTETLCTWRQRNEWMKNVRARWPSDNVFQSRVRRRKPNACSPSCLFNDFQFFLKDVDAIPTNI
jgi:hypothetical protein